MLRQAKTPPPLSIDKVSIKTERNNKWDTLVKKQSKLWIG